MISRKNVGQYTQWLDENAGLSSIGAEDDTAPEQAWMYLNTQRRVRRIATGQKTDAFLGSDIMIEDFLGYKGVS